MSLEQSSASERMRTQMQQAFELFTGGTFRPSLSDPAWTRLMTKLENDNITPHEFCYYVVHGRGPTDRARLQYKNLLTSEKLWNEFTLWKGERVSDVALIVKLQRNKFNSLLALFKNASDLLLNESHSFNAVMRCDMALMFQDTEKFDAKPVLDKFSVMALYTMLGSPEYQAECPYITRWLKAMKELE